MDKNDEKFDEKLLIILMIFSTSETLKQTVGLVSNRETSTLSTAWISFSQRCFYTCFCSKWKSRNIFVVGDYRDLNALKITEKFFP